MPSTPLTYLKFGIVAIVEIAIAVAMLTGKIDVAPGAGLMTAAATGLVVALGLSSAGQQTAQAIMAHTRAMVLQRDDLAAPDRANRGTPVTGQRGFVAVRTLLALACGVALVGFGYGLLACGPVSSQTATDVQGGLNAAVCIIGNSVADGAAGMSPAQVVADVVAKCGVSVAQVSTIFDALASAADQSNAPTVAAKYRALSAAAQDGGK